MQHAHQRTTHASAASMHNTWGEEAGCPYKSQIETWMLCHCAVYGTVVVTSLAPDCGVGAEQGIVQRIASAMVWSTWIFSVILW